MVKWRFQLTSVAFYAVYSPDIELSVHTRCDLIVWKSRLHV